MRKPLGRTLWITAGLVSAVALTGTLALVMYSAPRQAAASPTTLYVGTSAGADSGCASPGYTSIQAAVDAATAGGTVYLCASGSPYVQSVDISKSLMLTGDAGATIQAPAVWPSQSLPAEFAANSLKAPEAIVFIWGQQTHATVRGLTITGPFAPAGCGSETFGVLALDGATASISDNTVSTISDTVASNLLGCQHGLAIQFGAYFWSRTDGSSATINDAAHATIAGNTVSGYQKNGITVKGAGTTASITGNHVYGSNRDANYSPAIAQNGIEVAEGATAQVRGNYVAGNTYTGPAYASGSGIIIFGGCGLGYVVNAHVMDNTLVNNDVGVYDVNYAEDCVNPAPVRTNDKVTNNTITNDAVTNVGAFSLGSANYTGYQAGVSEQGNNDKIINNDIGGAGYATQQASGGPFVLPVDTVSAPTTAPKVHANQLG